LGGYFSHGGAYDKEYCPGTDKCGKGLISVATLASANVGIQMASPFEAAKQVFPKSRPYGCSNKAGDSLTPEILSEVIANQIGNGSESQLGSFTDSDTYTCINCVLVGTNTQYWCQHLSTTCDDGYPWHENYEKERQRKLYECPRRTWYCFPWTDSGCCGSSDSQEPNCTTQSGDGECLPGTLPPEIG
jgi:hypothetical protein